MIRTFLCALAALLALALGACASGGGGMQVSPASVAMLAGVAGGGTQLNAVGTLATNPCEIATAAGYTATIAAGRKIEKHLRAGKITPTQAQPAIDAGKDSIRMLDGACVDKNTVDPVALALATKRIGDLRKLVEAFDASK